MQSRQNLEGTLCLHAGTLFIADWGNNRVRTVVNGIIRTVAGTGAAAFNGDGIAATSGALNGPTGVTYDNKTGKHHNTTMTQVHPLILTDD